MLLARPRLILLAALLSLAGCHSRPAGRSEEPWVISPIVALEALQAKALYYNGPAWAALLAKRPDLLAEDDRAVEAPKHRNFDQAAQDPDFFRRLDRQFRFDALLLVGDPSLYRPLLKHLLETSDWRLAYLDHTSVVFRRNWPESWKPEALAPLRARMAALPKDVRAYVLGEIANKLVGVRRLADAKTVLDEAEQTHTKVPEVWIAKANLQMAKKDWNGAIESAGRALKLDESSNQALTCLSQSLYASGHFREAFAITKQLVAKIPDAPAILFHHAMVAHEAHEYEAEIDALKKLVERADRAHWSATGYRIFLGQAYLADGDAHNGLEIFTQVLAAPDLNPEQRKVAEDRIEQLRKVEAEREALRK